MSYERDPKFLLSQRSGVELPAEGLPDNIPPHLFHNVGGIVEAASILHKATPALLRENWTRPTDTTARLISEDILGISLLHPSDSRLTKTYTLLTDALTDEESSLEKTYNALIISDLLVHQTGLPLEEKLLVQSLRKKPDQHNQRIMSDTMSFFDEQPRTTEDTMAYQQVVAAHEERLAALEREAVIPPRSKKEHVQQIRDLNDTIITRHSRLFGLLNPLTSPAFQQRLEDLDSKRSHVLFANETATDLLLEGALNDIHSGLRYTTWFMSVDREGIKGNDNGTKVQTLSEYILANDDVRWYYWQALEDLPGGTFRNKSVLQKKGEHIHEIPRTYIESQILFMQDEDTVRGLFETFPWSEGKVSKQDYMKFTTLTSFVGLFQTLEPDHENIPLLRSLLAEAVEEKKLNRNASFAVDVVSDKAPGIVTYKDNQLSIVHRPEGQLIEKILPEDASLLYESKYQPKKVKKSSNREVAPVPQEETVRIASGENYFVPFWQEVQTPYPEDTARVVTHLDKQIHKKNPSEDILLDLAAQDVSAKTTRNRSVLLPSLLDADHPLAILGDAGIVGVDRSGDSFLFVIDAMKAGIATEGSQRIVLTGEMIADDLNLTNAPDDFDGSLLYLALTGAALLTRKEQTKHMKAGKKVTDRLDSVQESVVEWNRGSVRQGYPRIAQEKPYDSETAVIVPVTQSDVVAFTLKE